ncbi:MAG: sugar ABC transporter permease [Atribacterota bacterium]|jgi:multiple sugar transport system permease protein|uniref:Trehalose transport system permease protein SugA n=1 Tax=Atribacter laminatus TaxID=2847778 RepID=A0A7T1AL24_ATRLM|nr:sugar ABC transporter permease [Atribacter laminatus]MDI9595486.1 sugar ABC transporter permease [Atribacterota bacterium]QPM67814.1 Trehalose transport system permease protein SugA [Atribacter laminatus]
MIEKRLKYYLILPALIIFLGLAIYPLFFALRGSFFIWRYGMPAQFVGLKNYIDLFKSSFAWNALQNTIIYVVLAVFLELIIGLVLAVLMNRELGFFRPVVRTALTIPMFVSPIVVGIIWRMIYNPHYGLFNWLLGTQGFAPTGNEYALFFVVLADVWQWTPFMYVIILAALQSIPPEILEAGEIDGTTGWQKFIHITLPSISYAIVIALTLRFMDATKALDLIYTLTYGGPGGGTETIGFLIFRTAFNDLNIGSATSFAIIFTVVMGILITRFLGWLNRRFEIV